MLLRMVIHYKENIIDATCGRTLVNKTPTEAQAVIAIIDVNSQ